MTVCVVHNSLLFYLFQNNNEKIFVVLCREHCWQCGRKLAQFKQYLRNIRWENIILGYILTGLALEIKLGQIKSRK